VTQDIDILAYFSNLSSIILMIAPLFFIERVENVLGIKNNDV